jgi:RNA polymerase sigma-70 factor (ECF subfamily)
MSSSENEIVEKIRGGDKPAFENIFRMHYSHLCSYANKFVMDMDASEEIVQELFFQLWQKKETIIITSSLKSYLFRAVHNSCLNYIKHKNIRLKYKEYITNEQKESWCEQSGDSEINQLQDKIRQAIDKLPPERKKVFLMSRFDELSYKEVAEKLNISIKTVENQIGKALKFLREELKEYIPLLLFFYFELFCKLFYN